MMLFTEFTEFTELMVALLKQVIVQPRKSWTCTSASIISPMGAHPMTTAQLPVVESIAVVAVVRSIMRPPGWGPVLAVARHI